MRNKAGFAAKQSGKQVLIIDGVQSVGGLYETILQLDGHTIMSVSTIQEALSSVTSTKPDLIIATPDLFYLSGYELNVLADLKRADPTIPILAITTQKEPEFRQNQYVTEHLLLPFKMDQLRECVMRLVQGKAATETLMLYDSGALPSHSAQLNRPSISVV